MHVRCHVLCMCLSYTKQVYVYLYMPNYLSLCLQELVFLTLLATCNTYIHQCRFLVFEIKVIFFKKIFVCRHSKSLTEVSGYSTSSECTPKRRSWHLEKVSTVVTPSPSPSLTLSTQPSPAPLAQPSDAQPSPAPPAKGQLF